MHLTRLSNGLRLLTVPLQETKAVTVFVFTKVGSRYETRATNGLAHFIEHLMFKGTTKRPNTLAISRLLDGVGASYNAFTAKDWTGYYVKMNHEHTALALDVISDMLQHSKFDSREIERERGVIIEEINMYEDNPAMSIDDLFEQAVFGDHHPLGRSIAGPRQVIRRVSRRTILRFRDRYYHAKNVWVVVAGRIDPHLNRFFTQYFGRMRRRPANPPAAPYRPRGPVHRIHCKKKPVDQIQAALGTAAYAYTDRRLPALNLLSVILGGNMSSRLFIQVRERRGLAYSVQASAAPYEDTGSFMIQAGVKKDRLAEALKVMVTEMRKLKTTTVSTAELRRAKEFLRGKMIIDMEDSDAQASWYGRQALFNTTIETPDQAMAKIAKVTAADIRRVARHLFRPAAMRLAIIGPVTDATPLQSIIASV